MTTPKNGITKLANDPSANHRAPDISLGGRPKTLLVRSVWGPPFETPFSIYLIELAFLAAVAVTTGGNHGNGVRQESHLAGALNSVRDVVLMLRASASDATGLDLATIGHVLTEELSILVIDVLSVLLAELAVLTTRLTCRVIISHVKIPFIWHAKH